MRGIVRPIDNTSWTSQSPYDRFHDFIALGADRFAVLVDHLENLDLNILVIHIEENRHILVFPDGIDLKLSPGSPFPFRGESPVVLTAHYDRVEGSQGANDNSAAVFMLIKAALRLKELGAERWMIIFTDKEELKSGEGIQKQGACGLAKRLFRLGLGQARVFNFDACGTGGTFIFSSTVGYLLEKVGMSGTGRTAQRLRMLQEGAIEMADNLGIGPVLAVPAPFSDDAGFLQGGIPSQTITMLPRAEAAYLLCLLRRRPTFADTIIGGTTEISRDYRNIPETWRCINGPEDSHFRLTPEHFPKIVRLAVELCRK
ncbi:MAG: M28 family peptidase [Treponema sp.]|nr:M28 family peptidase [Treponema sp.]